VSRINLHLRRFRHFSQSGKTERKISRYDLFLSLIFMFQSQLLGQKGSVIMIEPRLSSVLPDSREGRKTAPRDDLAYKNL
jgi:hypothetical protein